MSDPISGVGGAEQPNGSEKLHRQNEPAKFDLNSDKKAEKEFDLGAYKELTTEDEREEYLKSLSSEQQAKAHDELFKEGFMMMVTNDVKHMLEEAQKKEKERKAQGG